MCRHVALLAVLTAPLTVGRADDWPMFMHDAGHTGVSAESLEPPVRQAWALALGRSSAAPIVAGGTVYVGNWDGEPMAVGAADGKLMWKYRTAGPV